MTDDRVFAKCVWRLITFTVLLYIVNSRPRLPDQDSNGQGPA
jgi:hypothetical protein